MNKTYPEHEKMSTIVDKSQAIGEFLEWINDVKGYKICKYLTGELWPIRTDTEHLLAEYFNINLRIIEKEKREMLNEIISENNRHGKSR